MKNQEKELKAKFYRSPFAERASIKRELTALQEAIFEKKEAGKSVKFCVGDDEMLQKLKTKYSTSSATNPQDLANLIKEELKAALNGSQKFETGDIFGDIWEANHGQEFCYFGQNMEVRDLIANLARNRQSTPTLDRMTTRMVRVKRGDFSPADFDEIISLIRQVRNFLEEKDKQERQKTENIKLNNPAIFTQ